MTSFDGMSRLSFNFMKHETSDLEIGHRKVYSYIYIIIYI